MHQSTKAVDSDSDWETDEEVDVVVKLSGVIRDEFMKQIKTTGTDLKASSLGLLDEEPLVQIGNDLFKGNYGHPAGTHLILKTTPGKDSKPSLSYVCTSEKELVMNKLYIQEKQPDAPVSEEIVASASKPDSGERTDATESTSTIDVMDTSQPQKDVDSIIPDVQASTEHSHSDPSVTPDQSVT